MNQLYAWAALSKWELIPLKYLFDVLNGATPSSSELSYWDGNIFWATPEDIGSLYGKLLTDTRRKITEDGYLNSGTQLAPAGSIVLTTRAPVGNLAVSTIPLCTNQGCKTLVPKSAKIHVTYYYYHLLARKQELQILATGTTFNELASDELSAFKLLSPSFEEQCAIADMLDRETARLDELIAEKERLLELLAEKRRALITHVVTRGLNNDAPLRDSGLQWFGQLPATWQVFRIKFLISRIDQGWSPQCYNFPAEEGQWGVLKTGCVNGGIFDPNENKTLPGEIEPPLDIEVKLGDVLISRASGSTDLIGSVALVDNLNSARLLLSDKIYRLRLEKHLVNPRYFVLAMSSLIMRFQIKRMISGAEGLANNIAQSDIRELLLPLPTLNEQQAIVDFIETETNKLDELRDETTETVSLLKERRASLIAAAVTGQIPVKALQ